MISIDRETKLTFDKEDAWMVTKLARFAIEVIQSKMPMAMVGMKKH